jgi:3-polyprenyl-4-hydroxybenzoate decarboxylase
MTKYIVALTGASGVVYGIELTRQLLEKGIEIHLVASDPAIIVIEQELGWSFHNTTEETFKKHLPYEHLFVYENKNNRSTDRQRIIYNRRHGRNSLHHGQRGSNRSRIWA